MNSDPSASTSHNLDTVLKVTTPEGIELALHPAGPVPRVWAWLLDLTWRFAVLFALALTAVAGFPFSSLVLAFSPGGLVVMSLIALTLDIDTAFVATHHIARIGIVVIVVPIAFRLLVRFGLIGPAP